MKSATFLAAAALAVATPAFAQQASAPRKIELPYTQFTLPNGLTVILHEDHAVPLVSTNMWYHVGSMTPKTVDAQRDVVKNERRQSYENRPYGQAELLLGELLYPEGHPYHWPVIGYMPDLTAASYEDVVDFFKKYYAPSNASLVVAGDIDPVATRRLVEKWFGDIKAGPSPEPMTVPGVALTGVTKKTVTDKVQLPRIYLAWLTPPHFGPGDAAMDMVADA